MLWFFSALIFVFRYTENAWDVISKLPSYGSKYKTQYIEATHILKAIIDQGPTGLAQRIIAKAGIDTAKMDK
jgi:ATP-dependent Clp protease ATP-binding subunit ClpA